MASLLPSTRILALCLVAALAASSAAHAQTADQALQTLLQAEDLYFAADYAACGARLDAFWKEHPPGTEAWARMPWRETEQFYGHPPAYYALRMLTDCLEWRLAPKPKRAPKPATAQLTVLLVGRSAGIEPRTSAELMEGKGAAVEHELERALLEDDHRIIHQSLALFREHVLAMTEGRLQVEVEIEHLKKLQVPVETAGVPRRFAGLAGDAWAAIWAAVPADTRATTDWWWVLYPSHVPERHTAFARTEFITGGMGSGPDGGSPCFTIDDRWLTRKPPHLGSGPYTDDERRAYLPQWLQHEFFHHLFRTWPEFGLEAEGHQWFQRDVWPEDFEGRLEPDYFHEALHKRLQPRADPPLHVGLRYAPPPQKLFARLKIADLLGEYAHTPAENGWHTGRIDAAVFDGKKALQWTNAVGVSWALVPDLRHGVLRIGPDNPYWKEGAETQQDFQIALERDADGDYLPEPVGFRFGGGLYRLWE